MLVEKEVVADGSLLAPLYQTNEQTMNQDKYIKVSKSFFHYYWVPGAREGASRHMQSLNYLGLQGPSLIYPWIFHFHYNCGIIH